jgi:hopanoid C-3 methylase
MIWKFNKVYNADRQYSDHLRDVEYLLPPPKDHRAGTVDRKDLYIHAPVRRRS